MRLEDSKAELVMFLVPLNAICSSSLGEEGMGARADLYLRCSIVHAFSCECERAYLHMRAS